MDALRIHDGSRIAIVGGGPAGAFFAHFALQMARRRGLDVQVIVFDGKDFVRRGPPGCNMCAGVVSEGLVTQLEEEGIHLPDRRVQRRLDGYRLHVPGFDLPLTHPEARQGTIRTVYRGGGPRRGLQTAEISFDRFLLNHLESEGARFIQGLVRHIDLPVRASQPVRLHYQGKESPAHLEADLVVGAFGLHSGLLTRLAATGCGYRPPRSLRTCQAELRVGADHIQGPLEDSVHIFSLGVGRIRFATFTPKREHITVTVVGHRDVDLADLKAFLAHPRVRSLLPAGDLLPRLDCYCRPKVPVGPSRRPFADRLVIVGDASYSRHYKNGLESAFATARMAAEAAFNSGISGQAFATDYALRARRSIVRDNRYGRLLFRAYDLAATRPLLARTYGRVARGGGGDEIAQSAREILWNMVTGNVPYRSIFLRALEPRLYARLVLAALGVLGQGARRLVWPHIRAFSCSMSRKDGMRNRQ